MGSHNPTTSDRTRVSWTAAMERYFIDLMLDQLHRGNRLGHTFNKQAWTDMMTLFNLKFGTKFDRDALKTHYSVLWKQYNDVKILLEQNGFYWDDSRKMVVAEGNTWDAYIKANPDAQAFRNRALTYFDDMCLIYGYTQADGRYSRSSHDVDFDDEVQVVITGVEIGGVAPESLEPAKSDWTPEMDQYFIELMLDQLRKGNKRKNTFTKRAWKDMLFLFNARFCMQQRKRFLKRRYKKLFKYYTDIKTLLDQRGFSWDEKQQMVVADDDIWDNYNKAHPLAHSFRKTVLLNYRDLDLIYANESNRGLSVGMRQGEELQVDGNRDCLRTNWTPLMDRYFIDLMLDQVHKGNKTGYTFSNEAWIDMALSFVDRFGLQYDKDLLKIQHNSLGKVYNDLKNLLAQRGFSWDERKQMVTAYGGVWAAYIKEHPDAESYKNKPTPNYNDLCLIYGTATSDGIHNRSIQNNSCNGLGTKPKNDCCSTTDWTPPMDRFFIDLMLEQVRQGGMIDQKFSKHAWAEMVAKFRAEFGSQHNKDVLKSRFMNLKKRFNDMKNLLDQSGFIWDEMKQMITAHRDLWDACVKEYPEARPYCHRTLPNFNDLFLIYGSKSTDTGPNCLSYSMDNGDYPFGVEFGEEDDQSPNNGNSASLHWTYPMERYFLDLLLEQVHMGNKIGHKFNDRAWSWMIASFNEKFGLQCDKGVLEELYFSLMEEYSNITDFLSRNGFVWDDIQQTVVADDDVWESYIQEYADAFAFRENSLRIYDDLRVIFGYRSFNGRLSAVGAKVENDDNIFTDLHTPAAEFDLSDKKKKRKSATSSASAYFSRKVRRPIKEEILEALDEKPYLMGTRTDDKEQRDYNSVESIVDALQTVPGMDNDELFLQAIQLLEDDKNAKIFIEMDVNQRRKWLLRKLHRR